VWPPRYARPVTSVDAPPADPAARGPEPQDGPAAQRVSTLELFFDLVFVFTITQLTSVLSAEQSWAALVQVVLMLGLIWWMYGGYAWLTNAVSTRGAPQRAFLLGGMAGYLVLALAIPDAFDSAGVAFGLGYAIVVAVHATLFIRSAAAPVSQSFRAIAPYNVLTAAMVLVGGAIGGDAQYALWTAAVLIEWLSPHLRRGSGFQIAPAHFVERHGLVVIIAIGESVVAVGIGAAGLPVTGELVLVAALGLLLSAGLWWAYFGADDDLRAEQALAAAPMPARPMMALNAFGRAHLVLLLGIVLVAVGLKKATGHGYDPLSGAQAAALGAGVAVFLLGDIWFRRVLALGRSGWRLVAALGALVVIPTGSQVAAVVELALLVALLAAALAAERRSGT
jgi:low temperature requirement protein LtrA